MQLLNPPEQWQRHMRSKASHLSQPLQEPRTLCRSLLQQSAMFCFFGLWHLRFKKMPNPKNQNKFAAYAYMQWSLAFGRLVSGRFRHHAVICAQCDVWRRCYVAVSSMERSRDI